MKFSDYSQALASAKSEAAYEFSEATVFSIQMTQTASEKSARRFAETLAAGLKPYLEEPEGDVEEQISHEVESLILFSNWKSNGKPFGNE